MEENFSLVCQMTDDGDGDDVGDGDGDGDGDDGACTYMLLYSGSYFDHLRPSRDALHHHVLQASCQEDSFGVTHSSHALLSTIHHIGAGRCCVAGVSCTTLCACRGYYYQD